MGFDQFDPTPPPPVRGGVLYNSLFGDGVKGGSMQFDRKGPGIDHHVVYGDGFHFSWDSDREGNVFGVHGTIHHSDK